jgi:hypothetical protein
MPVVDCTALKQQLDNALAILDRMMQPGVRAVQDSDGSRIEYSLGNLQAWKQKVALLQAEYDRCCRRTVSGPFRPIF